MQAELTAKEPAKTPCHERRTGLGWLGDYIKAQATRA